jgi:hypothetical protein
MRYQRRFKGAHCMQRFSLFTFNEMYHNCFVHLLNVIELQHRGTPRKSSESLLFHYRFGALQPCIKQRKLLKYVVEALFCCCLSWFLPRSTTRMNSHDGSLGTLSSPSLQNLLIYSTTFLGHAHCKQQTTTLYSTQYQRIVKQTKTCVDWFNISSSQPSVL